MARLLGYFRPYWHVVLVSLFLLLANSLLQIVGPLLIKTAVDRYLVPVPLHLNLPWDRFLSPDPSTGLAQLAGIYLAVIIAGLLMQYGQTYLMQWTGQRAMFDLRRQLMACLQRLDIAFYDGNPVGRLVTRVTTDVLADVLLLSFVLVAMFELSPELTLVLLMAAPFVIGATVLFRRSVSDSYRRIRVAIARINAYVQEHVTGISVLQLFNREERSRREFDRINRSHMEAYKDAIFAYGWFYPVVEFIGMAAVAGLLGYGGYQIQRGPIRHALLPPHPGPEREVQHPPIRHGGFRARLRPAGYGGRHQAPGPAEAVSRRVCCN